MKKCLIVVDYQHDFIDGALGFPGGLAIKEHIISKIKAYRKQGADIVFTKDTHFDDYEHTEEGDNLPVAHCIKGTKGHQIHEDVQVLIEPEDLIFEKHTFPSLDLANHLQKQVYEVIELCGLVSNICVLSNAVMAKSARPNAHIIVDAKATASADQQLHLKSLDVMKGLHIEVLNDEETE